MDEVTKCVLTDFITAKQLRLVEYFELGNGLINETWLLKCAPATTSIADPNLCLACGMKKFVLQRVNKAVFREPLQIDENIRVIVKFSQSIARNHKNDKYKAMIPELVEVMDGITCVRRGEGPDEMFFRVFAFVDGSHSYTSVSDPCIAFEAARMFGLFTASLNELDVSALNITLPHFHNLGARYDAFTKALSECTDSDRLHSASCAVEMIKAFSYIVETYEQIVDGCSGAKSHEALVLSSSGSGSNHCQSLWDQQQTSEAEQCSANSNSTSATCTRLPQRVMHHDTKISNVLFDTNGKGLCVIDLDTVMPGYFISDLGDMLRTYICPYSEEEADLSLIHIRTDLFSATVRGYLQSMRALLSPSECKYLFFSGEFMMFMQAIRFLADYLSGDIYYPVKHARHNLDRAMNQLTLLVRYNDEKAELQAIIDQALEV